MADPLDNPVWHALTGPHAHLASGNDAVLRYPSDVTMFYGVPDPLGRGVTAIADVAAPGDVAVLMSTGEVIAPNSWVPIYRGLFHQMVCTTVTPAAGMGDTTATVRLGSDDVDDMLALVALTEPGPFLARTHTLGTYIGARENGRLVAMAGQRMRVQGATEVSAVCTHPDARGRGYAAHLVSQLASDINDAGERAFLHVSVDNTAARAIYERVGFTTRALITIQVFAIVPEP